MTTLKQDLEELEHLNAAIQQSNYYTEEEAHEEITTTVKKWLKEFIESYKMDSMEEAVYVLAFAQKLENSIEAKQSRESTT